MPTKRYRSSMFDLNYLEGGVLVAHEKLFQEQPATYPYLRSRDRRDSTLVPNKVIVGLVSSAAYSGDYSKSPLYFQTYDCSSMGLYIDGQSYPAQPLQPIYGADQFVDCYRTLALFRKDTNMSRDDYKEGY